MLVFEIKCKRSGGLSVVDTWGLSSCFFFVELEFVALPDLIGSIGARFSGFKGFEIGGCRTVELPTSPIHLLLFTVASACSLLHSSHLTYRQDPEAMNEEILSLNTYRSSASVACRAHYG